ncbi:hypothetical protein KQX54_017233 [Cotesia glomerata]|uniref:Uncharacterized protein n=1 Tax=Cotesia glomerata TaxID=32391 RepID=A0AAV7HV39_COTGL|nr:hypothetical protein KQX54_017233 [Cotesia glomerata]
MDIGSVGELLPLVRQTNALGGLQLIRTINSSTENSSELGLHDELVRTRIMYTNNGSSVYITPVKLGSVKGSSSTWHVEPYASFPDSVSSNYQLGAYLHGGSLRNCCVSTIVIAVCDWIHCFCSL